ncbi:hypothetical protein [Parabacteroides massiliensis]|uniref:hypothetical protein n=1 Tax=Parabacteroides massiliensis TaxID=1750560 RepID=UPI00096A35B3|nr:hypothetical protein [Parabacteroides massiliensis]
MDNAGDWLYIVFLAIAGISSLFSSKNKKKRPKQILGQPDKEIVTSEKEVPAKGFWEILEEMQKPEPVKQPAAAPKPFLAGEKMADRQSSARNRLATPPAEEESPLTEIEFDNAAELRKAVIYTEILNRKY